MKTKNIDTLINSLKELNDTLEFLIAKIHREAAKVGHIFVTNKEKNSREFFLQKFRARKKDKAYNDLLDSVNKFHN